MENVSNISFPALKVIDGDLEIKKSSNVDLLKLERLYGDYNFDNVSGVFISKKMNKHIKNKQKLKKEELEKNEQMNEKMLALKREEFETQVKIQMQQLEIQKQQLELMKAQSSSQKNGLIEKFMDKLGDGITKEAAEQLIKATFN